jgi:hypothetical protein
MLPIIIKEFKSYEPETELHGQTDEVIPIYAPLSFVRGGIIAPTKGYYNNS